MGVTNQSDLCIYNYLSSDCRSVSRPNLRMSASWEVLSATVLTVPCENCRGEGGRGDKHLGSIQEKEEGRRE